MRAADGPDNMQQSIDVIADTQGLVKPELRVVLAGPRGFCAGVDRAIRVVEEALRRYGKPVYVRHEIVHNRTVVEELEAQGAVFVEELDEVPPDGHVVFSAHGVPKSVPAEAERRNLLYLDATCPLVSKVHREAERHFAGGGAERRHILMIGHAGHPEVVGTMGQLPPGSMTLVQSVQDAETVEPADPSMLAFITQTTLSVDDTAEIVDTLRRRFPAIEGPKREDICYATTNRASGGEGGGAELRPGDRDRQPEQQQLAAAAGGGRAGRGVSGDPAAEGGPAGLVDPGGCADDGPDGRGVGAGVAGAGAAAGVGGAVYAADRGAAGDAGGRGVQAAGSA